MDSRLVCDVCDDFERALKLRELFAMLDAACRLAMRDPCYEELSALRDRVAVRYVAAANAAGALRS